MARLTNGKSNLSSQLLGLVNYFAGLSVCEIGLKQKMVKL